MVVSLNYCSQNGGNVYRAPYYNRNLNIGPRIDSNLRQSPYKVPWGLGFRGFYKDSQGYIGVRVEIGKPA